MSNSNIIHVQQDDYLFTTNKAEMVVADIHQWLSTASYWAAGVSIQAVQQAFDHSFCIGILHQGRQVGYARLITDYTNIAYLADVYVHTDHQAKGLGKKMLLLLMGIDWVQQLKKILLATTDAHGLYKQFGFHGITNPEKLMQWIPAQN